MLLIPGQVEADFPSVVAPGRVPEPPAVDLPPEEVVPVPLEDPEAGEDPGNRTASPGSARAPGPEPGAVPSSVPLGPPWRSWYRGSSQTQVDLVP